MVTKKSKPSQKRSVGRRLAVSTTIVSFLLLAVVFVFLFPLERAASRQAKEERLSLLADTIATAYEVVDEETQTHPAKALLLEFSRTAEITRIEVTDAKGIVRASHDGQGLNQKREIDAKRLRHFESKGDYNTAAYNIPWTQNCVGCHAREDGPVGSVRVVAQKPRSLTTLERFHLAFGVSLFFILLTLAALVLFLTKRLVTKPVAELERVMRRAARGDVLVRAQAKRPDEVGRLALGFNRMLESMTAMKASEIEREADLQNARRELAFKEQIEDINERLKASHDELSRRVRAQALLMEAAHRFGGTLNQQALIDRLDELLRDTFEWPDFAVYVVDQDDSGEACLRCESAHGYVDTEAIRKSFFKVGQGVTGFVADTGATHLVHDLKTRVGLPSGRDVEGPVKEGAMLAVPMLHKGVVIGVIDFFAKDAARFDQNFSDVMQALAVQAAMAMVNAQLYERTHELSITDPLTGLMNRRALERRMEIEVTRAQRFTQSLTMLMIDVDHFKQYNDRMGHLLGDDALIDVARALRGNVRAVDSVARFGGEEFSVILPLTGLDDALEVAEKLRTAVNALELKGAKGQPLGKMSVSIGLAVFPEHMPLAFEGSAGQVLLNRADAALYQAKHNGRDRVQVAE